MAPEPISLERGPVWSTGRVAEQGARTASGLPVRWSASGATNLRDDPRGGDVDVVGVGDEPGVQPAAGTEPEPDAVARGWVVPPGASRVDAIFVLTGTSLGIGRAERATTPVWLDLGDLVNLDAIGDPVDGLTEVEITMADQRVIGAGWTDEFIDAVVGVLQGAAAGPPPSPDQPAPAPVAVVAPAPEPAPVTPAGVAEPAPGPLAPAPVAPAPVTPAPVTASSALELEDVVYLGGHPAHTKRRKKCVVSMTRSAFELTGPGGVEFSIGWDVVRTIEVQNADEARFRTNTKIHRDASALVLECDQDVTILVEARDCPTIALRSAMNQLLDGLDVVVV